MLNSTTFSHEIVVDGPPDEVLALLTPEGERRWVPGWEPVYGDDSASGPNGGGDSASGPDGGGDSALRSPTAPDLEEGLVFTTHHGGETTLWYVGTVDRSARRYEYHRFTPGSRVAVVRVGCEPEADGRTRVLVTYEVTVLSPHGRAVVEAMKDGFVEEIEGWVGAMEGVLR